MTDDIFSRIREDHDKHRTLARIIERTSGDSRGRNELFPKLADDVRAHARAEERVFYSELLAATQSRDLAGHSVKEHHEIEAIIEELLDKDYSSTGWLARFKTLTDKLRHHMLEEEKNIFPLAGRVLSEARKREMVIEFDAAKQTEARKVA
ncbi:hemerythrin domain-containing protein [Enhygromyxa salina]|uniref:Hemerythrin-like domain-containing protein n=1 Tax=Enhygromyxa salina TaxID=215803 RepID=A0A2S9XP38_9BACT|nr:hemerythrin domain-containing protein [Enhygromyxa salina]PRP94451.1 hypothetical protein ENSA7_77850 [Enhygromyxa salina]